ncbi:hypothetical protein V5O48_015844 [Marasmius crinis-equi]|uniref:HTH CENPB-type domain-containing protein n=1 Tax=Marasmius crinis-equi TaxID=585013 RepID=A0ABR3ETE1_9AGAR
MLKEVVDKICRACLGNAFPKTGAGEQWAHHFVEKHSNCLKTFWSSKLDSKRGCGVNPNTNEKWFTLLGDMLAGKMDHEFDMLDDADEAAGDIDWESIPMPQLHTSTEAEHGWETDTEHTRQPTTSHATEIPTMTANQQQYIPISPDCFYRADESGFIKADATKTQDIGSSAKKMQHQQGGGGRENTTVIVTICADGTAIRPSMIFKGTHYNVNWVQENPTQAS